MNYLADILRRHFGVVSSAQLRNVGLTPVQIRGLVAGGELTRLRHGWYADEEANTLVASAVRAGGVLSGATALQLHGVWTPPDQPVHVRLRRRESFIPRTTAVPLSPVVLPHSRAVRLDQSVDRPGSALLTSIRACPRDTAIVLADSALNLGLLSEPEIEMIAKRAGERGEKVLRLVSPSAGSGTETLFRLWLVRNRIDFQAQVQIPSVGRVDFVIGERLVVEIDSKTHHMSSENYANDRRRDRALVEQGYLVIRLTYADVMYHLDDVCQDILALIRRDEHRRAPRVHWR